MMAVFSALFVASAQSEQGQTDSLVRLMSAKYIEQVEVNGEMIRRASFPTFLHNGTYLVCDSALWNVNQKIINCFGNVQMTQGESVLTSEKLDYLVDENLATFRGPVVQLRNKKDNLLRTRKLDYNTKDSLALFFGGASMMSENGQIIESENGSYSNAKGLFTFRNNVNMFTDSVFVKTEALDYDSNAEKAHFRAYIDFWKEDNMLSAYGGWYDRMKETFFFLDRVHGLSREQEVWCDSLYYNRIPNDVLMLGNVHVQDTSRSVAALSSYMFYRDSLSTITMRNRAAVALWGEQNGKVDTTYMSSDTLVYKTIRRCDIADSEVSEAVRRLDEILDDAVAAYRKRAAAEAAQKAEQAKQDDPNYAYAKKGTKNGRQSKSSPVKTDGAGTAGDAAAAPADTLSPSADTLVTPVDTAQLLPPDTTKVGFMTAFGDIRIFRKDMQVRCDSLVYNDLDSIARLFKNPVIWNDSTRQYSSDSIFVLVKGQALDRASLMSSAFIITQEDSLYFNQIKSTDIMAFFDKEGGLRRFDALGGVSAMFYLEENEALATVNKVEGKMLSANLVDGNLDRVHWFDHVSNNAMPLVQMPAGDHRMKGFNWQKERAPQSKEDVTEIDVLPSERAEYESRPKAEFTQTDIYFPGHMKELYHNLDSVKVARRQRQAPVEVTKPGDVQDTSSVKTSMADSLVSKTALAVVDSLKTKPVKVDSLSNATAVKDTTYMSDRELKRALRVAKRDARWSELDRKDAEKKKLKEAKAEARRIKRLERLEVRMEKQRQKDQEKLEKYIERFQKQKERNERKQEPEPSGKRTSRIETGGELLSVTEQ